MKKINNFIRLLSFVLIISITACNLPSGAGSSNTPDINATVAAEVAIAFAAQTLVAQTLAAGGDVVPANTDTITPEALPQVASTETLTPTITLTPTPEGIFLVVSQDTNCRFGGPYSSFKIITTVKAGQNVEVLSRNPENDSYFVKNPYDANSTCWMYGKFATLTGNAAALPVSTMHPTPTPTYTPTPNTNFTVSFVSLESCGPQWAFKLHVKNNGGTIWQSISLSGNDTVTAFVINHTSNTFKEYIGCAVGLTQGDLTPGEESFVLNVSPGQFNYNPTGNLIKITVKLCSEDNLLGTCLSKNLSFTP